MRNTGIAVVPT